MLRGLGVGVHRDGCELQSGGESDQVLLDFVVEGALDGAALGVISFGESPPRRPQFVDLAAQSVELPHRVGLPLLQGHPLLRRGHPQRVFRPGAHDGSPPHHGGQPSSSLPAITVVQAHRPS